MHIQITVAGGLALSFEGDTYTCERIFAAARALPAPKYVDELQEYIDQVSAAAELPVAA